MHIIFITNFKLYKKWTDIKTVGGIETNTNDVIEELRSRGHEVWATERDPEPSWVDEGEVDIIAASTFDPLTYLKVVKYKKRFKDRAAVVIHAHTTVEDLKGNFLPDSSVFNGIFELWLRILYGAAHLVITPSGYSKKCIEDMQKQLTYPIHAVSNGIRIEKFEEKEEFRPNFRHFLKETHGIEINEKVILNVGLSWKKKGVDTFGEIARRLPEYFFVWVGPINDNPDIVEARELDNVVFTGFYDDIREPYYGADLFLNTSRNENQGIPLIEAAICKLPMVVSDLPAYDWVVDGESCLKANSIEEFVSSIEKMFSEPEFEAKLIENARHKAVELHDFSKIGDKIENLYAKALKVKQIWDRKRTA